MNRGGKQKAIQNKYREILKEKKEKDKQNNSNEFIIMMIVLIFFITLNYINQVL